MQESLLRRLRSKIAQDLKNPDEPEKRKKINDGFSY